MNVDDDLLARHRPAARFTAAEREAMLAGFAAPRHDGGHRDVLTLVRPKSLPPRRRSWLPAVAATVAVLTCAGGILAWQATRRTGGEDAADGDVRSTCAATLPGSWDDARATSLLQVDGHDATPSSTTPDGRLVLSWEPTSTLVAFGIRANSGAVTRIGTFPASSSDGSIGGGLVSDGRYAVYAAQTDGSASDEILLIDTSTGTRKDLLSAAPVPAGLTLRAGPYLLDGNVYWASAGAAPGYDDTHSVVLRYSIADATYEVLARDKPAATTFLEADVRGVAWNGGAVSTPGLPTALPPILDTSGDPVDRLVTDGSTFAWQYIAGDQTVFHWVNRDDREITYRVTVGAGHDGAGLSAVAGPFLFFEVNQAGQQNYVLDTRSGALAPLRIDEFNQSYAGGYLVADGNSAFEHRLIDTAKLPALHCD